MNMQVHANTYCSENKVCLPATNLPRVVVIGGGFAGLSLIGKLHKQKVQIVLIDKNNFHQFLPLLYQVATSGTEPDSIVFPFRKIFDKYENVIFRMGEVTRIDTKNNLINSTIGIIDYDYLIIAGGSTSNFFGNEGFNQFGLGLKSVTDALDIRSKLLQNLEKAAITCNNQEKKSLCSIAIAGGGPAGVEMAGALAEFKKYIFRKDYPELRNIELKIYLIEGADCLLSVMPKKLSDKTFRYLAKMKVDVLLNTFVKSYNGTTITLANGETIDSAAFIWTAGVKGTAIDGLPPAAINHQSRIVVDEFSRIVHLENVFAIGDVAQMVTEDFPKGHPMVAQPAIQQGKNVAGNLMRLFQNRPLLPFRYHDKGSLATVGKKRAVANIFGREFGGFLAWVIWSAVHLMSIVGVRNKLVIAINWMWSYFTYDKGDRVIIRKYVNTK